MLRCKSELFLGEGSPEILLFLGISSHSDRNNKRCPSLQHAVIKHSAMNLGRMMYRTSDRYLDAGRKTPLSLTALFLTMPRVLRCHLGDIGHCARTTGDEAQSSPWSLGTMNVKCREAILREISLKKLRWLDWHMRAHLVADDTGYLDLKAFSIKERLIIFVIFFLHIIN